MNLLASFSFCMLGEDAAPNNQIPFPSGTQMAEPYQETLTLSWVCSRSWYDARKSHLTELRLKGWVLGQWEGSVSKKAFCNKSGDLIQSIHGWSRKSTPQSCPLTVTQTLWHTRMCPCVHKHIKPQQQQSWVLPVKSNSTSGRLQGHQDGLLTRLLFSECHSDEFW